MPSVTSATPQVVTSVVTVSHIRNIDLTRGGSEINCTQARNPKARCHVCHICHANADWMSPSATHATQKSRGMDSRGPRGGETEAMDRRGQDHARYAKVTSDVKKGYKRKADVTKCHICKRGAEPSNHLCHACRATAAWMSPPRLLQKGEWEPERGLESRGGERRPQKRAGPRQTHVSDVSCHGEPQ